MACVPRLAGCVLFGLIAQISVGLAQAPNAKPAPAKEPYTVTYDVKDIVTHPSWHGIASSPRAIGGAIGPDRAGEEKATPNVEGLVEAVVDVIDGFAGHLRQGTWSIREVNGTQLEIKTTAATHEQVVDLLDAFRRLFDVAVAMAAELREVDSDFFDKQIVERFAAGQKVTPGRSVIPIDDNAALDRLRKQSELVKTHAAKIPNSWKDTPVLSLRTAFVYASRPGLPQKGEPDPVLAVGYHGLACRAAVVVSADRRTLRLKLEQDVTDLNGIKKEKRLNPLTEKEVEIEVPDLRRRSTDLTLTVDDGQTLLLPVDYRVPSGKDKERLLVLVLRPLVWIESEQKELKKDNGS